MAIKIFFLFILSLFALQNARAQSLTAASLEIKSKLEKSIQENLVNTISTRLEPSSFTVGVNVSLNPISEPEKNPPKKEEPDVNAVPLGMDLGIINAQELIASYERELAQLKEKNKNDEKEKKEEKKEQYQIKSIDVIVGLDEKYEAAYLREFDSWLKNKLRADYGNFAKSKTGFFKAVKIKPEPVAPPTLFDKVKDLQNLIGFAVIATALFLGMGLLWNAIRKVATAQKALQLKSDSEWNANIKNIEAARDATTLDYEDLDKKIPALDFVSNNELDKQMDKIALICMDLQSKLNDLVRVWIDSGEEGLIKTALLVDTLITSQGKDLKNSGVGTAFRTPLDSELIAANETSLSEAYRAVETMEVEVKIKKLEKVYWDLISVRTLGLQSLRRPFDFLTKVPTENIQEILNKQQKEAKALAMMYLTDEQKSLLIGNLEARDKEVIILDMLKLSQTTQKTIWDSDTSVKVSYLREASQPKEKLINLFPRTLEVIQSLSVIDEISILRKIAPSLPDEGWYIKTQYICLAFIDEWKPEYTKKLTSVSSADEIVALISAIPMAQDLILKECAPKIKTIVEDDLRIYIKSEKSDLNQKLSGLKTKWTRIVEGEKISLAKVIVYNNTGVSHAA